MIERRPALGKGLSALIPDTPEPPRQGAFEVDIDLLAPSDQQPRQMLDDDRLGGLAESNQGQRRYSAHPGSADRQHVSHHCRRTPVARRATGGAPQSTHRDPRCPRGVGTAVAGTRARRESPARKSQPSGRGTRLPASDRRLRPHPGADRRGRWQGPHVGHQLSAPASAARRSPRRPRLRRPLDGACAGAPGAAGCVLPASGRPGRHFQIAVSSRHRSAREKLTAAPRAPRPEPDRPPPDVHTRAAEDRMRFSLGTKVRIVRRDGPRKRTVQSALSGGVAERPDLGGTIEIDFGSESELHRLFERLTETQPPDPSEN